MGGDLKFRRLFVRCLSYNTRDADLRNYFEQFGAVAQAYVANDNGISKCYGFVTFAHLEGASNALRNRFHEIDGRWVKCYLAAFRIQTQPSSSTNRGPRMQLGEAAPHSSSSPFIQYPLPYTNPYMSPNNPIHDLGPMHGAGPIPPVYPYGQGSLWNECVTGNTLETTLATTSNTSQNVGPMYGPRSMTGLSSGSNGAATDNRNNMVHFRSPNYPMYDSVSLLDQHDQRPSGTGYFHPVTSQNRRNTGQNDGDRRGGGPMRRQEK